MVVFGRPKGYRGSYQQWLEDNIAPQVVFEIRPDGKRFLSYVELMEQRDELEQQRDRMAAKLQELGIDPTQL